MVEPPDEGVMVRAPPPTVETMVRPTLLVLVTTSPRVREGDEVLVVEAAPPADAEADALELELEAEPAAIAPLDAVLVEVVLPPAPADVVLVPAPGLEVVSPP